MFYRSLVGAAQNICKKGKSIAGIQPDIIMEKNSLPPNKKNDVSAFLSKHYGNDWRENSNLILDFYKHVLDGGGGQVTMKPMKMMFCVNLKTLF